MVGEASTAAVPAKDTSPRLIPLGSCSAKDFAAACAAASRVGEARWLQDPEMVITPVNAAVCRAEVNSSSAYYLTCPGRSAQYWAPRTPCGGGVGTLGGRVGANATGASDVDRRWSRTDRP